MLENFKFANINAKIKGMYSYYLKIEDYEEMLKQETIKEAIIFLKSKIKSTRNIDYNIGRRELEKELYQILIADVRKIYPLLDKKSQELLEDYIEKWRIKYDKGFLKYEDMEQVENKFFQEYYQRIYQKVKNYKDKTLLDMIGKQIDLYNILWTFRVKKFYNIYDKAWEDFEIPIHYKLSKEVLDRLNLGQESPDDIISKTVYHEFTLEEANIEKELQNYLFKLYINYFKTKSFSLAMVIAYIELIQIQINNIVTIIEGIRYHVDDNKIRKKLIVG